MIVKTFKQFISEGGNIKIGDVSADRIDLSKIDRTKIVNAITSSLTVVNKTFEKGFGLPLWDEDLFNSRKYLSGSAFHFFDLKSISNADFVKVKSNVGDIDTQIDGNLYDSVKRFLDGINGRKFGIMTFIGYKAGGDQFITLWRLDDFDINLQIDMEMVDYGANGKPTPFSQFIHSSAWKDLQQGIKGVAHKNLMRALPQKNVKQILIKAKSARGKDKEILTSGTVFGPAGIRLKYSPVLDARGNQEYVNNIPVYTELSTSDSKGNQNLKEIFYAIFGVDPSGKELDQMNSFMDLLDLIKTYLSSAEITSVVDYFANTLFGPGAGKIVTSDKQKDYQEKLVILKTMTNELGFNVDNYNGLIANYYKSF